MDVVKRLRGHAKGNAGGVRELLVLSADEIERLRQQVEDFALVARGAAYRIEDAKKSQRFLAMIDKTVGGK